ncbi:MAG: hypothetical protein A2020_14115 [Lentisphaerae bacterium GWF2_45_14]|nr:MAG: hypothetical protein A2020_14115 [Lentisphaerae bacterium GWF2_45_14]
MAEDIQGLLQRIHDEGLKKADTEKEKIISDANIQADSILKKAREEADSIVKKAAEEAAGSEARAKAAIKQAARDIILSLKEDLMARLNKVVKGSIDEAMTAEFMGKILLEMLKNYKDKNQGTEPELDILLNPKDLEKMEAALKSSLAEELRQNPSITAVSDFSAGLQIGFKGNDVFFDFTDDTLTEIICHYIGPRVSAMLND